MPERSVDPVSSEEERKAIEARIREIDEEILRIRQERDSVRIDALEQAVERAIERLDRITDFLDPPRQRWGIFGISRIR